MKTLLPPDVEMAVREQVAARLRVWSIAAGFLCLLLLLMGAYLAVELWKIKAQAVRLNQPLMIHNLAWDTVLDAVDPARFPGTHPDDVRKGTHVQQWPAHGGPQHLWELQRPYGDRYRPSGSAPKAEKPTQP